MVYTNVVMVLIVLAALILMFAAGVAVGVYVKSTVGGNPSRSTSNSPDTNNGLGFNVNNPINAKYSGRE